MVTRTQIEKLSKSIEALAGRLSPAAEIRTVQFNSGEDEGLIQDAWRQQNAELPEPQNWVLIASFGSSPRPPALCTQASLLEALPHLKAFIAQREAWDEAEDWRELCRSFQLDYDAIAAMRPLRCGYDALLPADGAGLTGAWGADSPGLSCRDYAPDKRYAKGRRRGKFRTSQ